MPQSIDNALVTQFSDMVHIEAEQMESRLRDKVKIKQITGEDYAYDRLDDVEAYEVTTRNQPTILQDIEHSRRQIPTTRIMAALPIDPKDDLGVLLNPQKEYAKQVVNALKRKFDKIVTAAAFADVKTGRQFGTTVTAANDGVTTIDATASGLTYEKLLEMTQTFMDNEVGNEAMERFYLTITGDENTDLMSQSELTSGDFSRRMPVDGGKMKQASEFELVHFGHIAASPKNILQENAAGTEKVLIAATTGAICVGISKDITLTIDRRPDLSNSIQVLAEMTMGAVRTEGKLIQKVRVAV
jgi:hypothetical protein